MKGNRMNLQPVECNICGGKVIYTSNAKIYHREYGSGKMYFCTECGAYVGTHISRPKEAFGILGNAEMRSMKMKCHRLFDRQWENEPTSRRKHLARRKAYEELAARLNIPVNECHFGYFDMDMLVKSYNLLSQEEQANVSV